LKNKIPVLIPKNGWKELRICQKCGELVKEGTHCKKCGTLWEKGFVKK